MACAPWPRDPHPSAECDLSFAGSNRRRSACRLALRALALACSCGACFGALPGALCPALHAQAAFRLDVGVEVILAVVVGDLVARRDVLDRLDVDAAVADHGIGVRAD